MDLEIMRRFLVIAAEGNLTRAARALHVSQPTLSRQMQMLEAQLGCELFERKAYSMVLSPEGLRLQRRARDLVDLADKIETEFGAGTQENGGPVYVSAAVSAQIRLLAKVAGEIWKKDPDFQLHVTDCGTEEAMRRLEEGLDDFALMVDPPDLARYSYFELPGQDRWGALIPADSPLARKERITLPDLQKERIFMSRQSIEHDLPRWHDSATDLLQIAATFNLPGNAGFFVRDGQGIYLCFEGLFDTGESSGLVFRPLDPPLFNKMYLVTLKSRPLSFSAARLAARLKQLAE